MSEYSFRWVLMLLCLTIFAAAFSALVWFAWRHHRGGQSEKTNFHSILAVEIAWTVVPCVVVLLLVWPTARIFWTP
jgi:cytochrome c oxidase subunit 2